MCCPISDQSSLDKTVHSEFRESVPAELVQFVLPILISHFLIKTNEKPDWQWLLLAAPPALTCFLVTLGWCSWFIWVVQGCFGCSGSLAAPLLLLLLLPVVDAVGVCSCSSCRCGCCCCCSCRCNKLVFLCYSVIVNLVVRSQSPECTRANKPAFLRFWLKDHFVL